MPDDMRRREIGHWVGQYLSGGVSFERLFELIPQASDDDEVAELLDLIVHEPKCGGLGGASPDEYARHMDRIHDLVRQISAAAADRDSVG
jgi:hypothetical protein